MLNQPAPELQVSDWLNAGSPPTLAALRGRVVFIEVFQMLCPGCVSHGIPLAKRVHDTFDPQQVAVIGLHSVFEHHAVQGTLEALTAFVHENRIRFPVALDAPAPSGGVPMTMRAYRLQGTPTLLLLDRAGRLRRSILGSTQDLTVGADIMALMMEDESDTHENTPRTPSVPDAPCDNSGCTLPETQP